MGDGSYQRAGGARIWDASQGGSKVLVVDDDLLNANLIYKYLTSVGYQVIKAHNGRDGLALACQEKPDLILLDVMMPGMNGFEVCQRLRSDPSTAYVPVVMVTALYETEERIAALEAGADDFLSKPFNIYELAARVKSLLRIKHQHDELERRNKLFYSVMTRYMAPEVSEQILHDPERYLQLGGESRRVTTLFADIRGFTRYAQTHSPDRVVELLNLVFKELTAVVLRWRGTFDKYLGDAIMALYGAPVSYEDDVLRALRTALDMQQAFQDLSKSWVDDQERSLGLGIGVHTGEVIIGNVGTESLMNYTAIGDAVNVAQRLEELAQGGQILITEDVYREAQNRIQASFFDVRVLRGREQETKIYELNEMI